tara:strand:- start:2305 stop:21015 length:18711 start_codon:yes stop_codon:yes gene_type:complete
MAEKLFKKLPGVLQTTANKNFFDSTVEQLFSPANVEVINGYIGTQKSEDYNVQGAFLRESTANRLHYSLSPALNTINPVSGVSQDFIFYDELVDTLKVSGVNTENHNKIFSTDYQTFLPPIDIDKFVNYQEYYWSNNDLDAILVSGTLENPIDIDIDVVGKKNFTSPNNITLKNGMCISFSGEFVIPQNKTGIDFYVEGVGKSIQLIPKIQNVATGYSTATLTTWDNTIFTELDSNVKHTAGNIISVNIDNAGKGYLDPVVQFTGANTTLATATANNNISGAVTDVTVTANGLGYSAPIGIIVTSTSVSTGFDAGNTLVSVLNEDQSTSLTPYNKITINDSSNIFINQEVIVNNERTSVTSLSNGSIISINNITNGFDSNRTAGTYTVSGSSGGSGTAQNFSVTVHSESKIQNFINVNDQKSTWSSNATILNARTSITKTGLATTGGTGSGATIDVVYNADANITISVNNPGLGYRRGDTLTVAGNLIDGVSGPNLTFDVLEVEKPLGITTLGNITSSGSPVDGNYLIDLSNSVVLGNISTSGSGKDAIFNVTVSSGNATIVIEDGGIDFVEGDNVVINGNVINSSATSNISFTVDNVIAPGDTTIDILNGGTGHAVGDTITITDADLGNGGGTNLSFGIARSGDVLGLADSINLDQGSNLSVQFIASGFEATVRTDMYNFTSNSSGTFTTGVSSMALAGVDPNTGDFYLGGNPDNALNYGWDLDEDGDGTGDAVWGGRTSQANPDYNVMQRGAKNRNIWSRVNFWHHKQNYLDANVSVPEKQYRAIRPIIEFSNDLELYNHGTNFIGEILVVEKTRTISDLNGAPVSILVDGSPLAVGATLIFPNESVTNSKFVYKVSHSNSAIQLNKVGDPNLNPAGAEQGDGNFVPLEFKEGDVVNVKAGETTIGTEWYFTDGKLLQAQEKTKLHQAPLFNLYNDSENYLGDTDVYDGTNFAGNKIFNYKVGTGINDNILGFPLSYKQYYSSSEIQFENCLETNRTIYTENGSKTEVPGYYYYKTTEGKYHNNWLSSNEKYKQPIKTYYYIDRFDVNDQNLIYFVGCLPDVKLGSPSGYDIVVERNGKIVSDYTYTERGLIKFNSFTFEENDVIEVTAYSKTGLISERSISKYEIPISWDRNTEKLDISNISEPEYLTHFSNYMKYTQDFSGESLGSNNFKDLQKTTSSATDIIKTDENLILGAFLLGNKPHNILDAIEFNHKEYIRYKNRLKSEITKYLDTVNPDDYSNEFILEKVLRNVIAYSLGNDVFQQSYVIPFGDNYITEEKIINSLNDTSYTLNNYKDFTFLENTVQVYKKRGTEVSLLDIDKDYTLTSNTTAKTNIIEPTSTCDLQLADILIYKIYDKERDSAECPPTPSFLGLYPLFEPEIITDSSFDEPIEVLIGHDGSKTATKGNREDQILLEFEKRIFNSAKKEFRQANSLPGLSVFDVRAGKFREDYLSHSEWYDLMRANFTSWSVENKVDFVKNEFYDNNKEFTWNYRGDTNIPGYWRGWYEFYYDTVKPHLCPWEMLGFFEKPSWWDSQYITNTYTNYGSNNTPMWEDIEDGLIRQGPRENLSDNAYKTKNKFARPGLKNLLPVDSNATLKSPYNIESTGSTTRTEAYTNTIGNTSLGYSTTSYLNVDGVNVRFDSSNVYVSNKNLPNYNLSKIDTTEGTLPWKALEFVYAIPRVNLNIITESNTSLNSDRIGVLVNGLTLHNINSGTTFNNQGNWTYNTGFLQKTNRSNGFISATDSSGVVTTTVPTSDMSNSTVWGNSSTHSGIVGWAFDGLPIYGPYGYTSYYSNGIINNNSITNVKSSFELKPGSRSSHPNGAHTGLFLEDYQYSASLASQPGRTGKFNTRYGVTPESPSTPIRFYVVTIDDNDEPMFPYAVGGGTTSDNTYNGSYFATPLDVTNNNKGTITQPASITGAVSSSFDVTLENKPDDLDKEWRFGDGAPVENAWKYSSSYPFAIVNALMLSKPGKFATVFADPIRQVNSKLGGIATIDVSTRITWKFNNANNFVIHGSSDDDNLFLTNIGYTQFIKSWLGYQNYSIGGAFTNELYSINTKLSHRMAGFVDKDTATIKSDQYSTTGNATSLIIPTENTDITIHDSGYKTRNNYTGVIIEKVTNGFKVKGFDTKLSYFNILESDKLGPVQSIERGGTPADFVNWAVNKSYPFNTIVQHLGVYYQAKDDVPASDSFINTQWNRLPALPQINGVKGLFYQESTGIIKKIDYNKEFTTAQEVFDLLISIGRYQESIGYNFGDYDDSINAVKDWLYSAEQFLFFVSGGWEIGNTLELSPGSRKIMFSKPTEFVSEVKRVDKDQFSILDQDGKAINPKECEITRDGNKFEIVPPLGKQIYSITLYTKQIEHVLSLDSITAFNDTIYNNLYNQKLERLFIKGKRTLGWEGRLSSEGFVIDGGELQPNLDNITSTMREYHRLGFIPVDKQVYNVSRALIGFENKPYLTELGIVDDDQVEFYKGMIQSKGTLDSIGKILNSNAIVQGNVNIYDEWALKAGSFGDLDNNQSIELRLEKQEIAQDPQLVKLEFPEDITGIVKEIVITERNTNYFEVPEIEISAPTVDPKKQANAVASLKTDGTIDAITITEQGSGYEEGNTSLTVLTSNLNVSKNTTTFNYVSALSSANFPVANVTGVANITIIDHFASNTSAQTIDLSAVTDVANIVTAINNNGVTNANISATAIQDGSNTIQHVLQINGSDFTLGGSGLANLNITGARYQPRQRYGIITANNTVVSDVVVAVDNTNVPRTEGNVTYWEYDAGDRFQFTTSTLTTSGSFDVDISSLTGILNSSSVLADENITLVEGQYPYVEVYINGNKLENTTSQSQYSVPNNTTVRISDVTNLQEGNISPNANIYIVEKATVDFTDSYQGDVPASNLLIKVQNNEGFSVQLGSKRIFDITPDIKNDEIISIDIDDKNRFLKKPSGIRTNQIWPSSSNVDYTGLKDPDYRKLPNAGYVERNFVNYQSFGVIDLPQLFNNDRIFKPSANNLIHVAKSENDDWNVYKLREPQDLGVTFIEQEGIDDTAYLYTTVDLFNYVDSNQLQQEDLSRYLDYTLILKNAEISDNVVLWTNQEVVDKKSALIKNFGAISIIQSNVDTVGVSNTSPFYNEFTAIAPAPRSKFVGDIVKADANNVVTMSTEITTIKNGDQIELLDMGNTNTTHNATSLQHLDTANATSGSAGAFYDSKITITASNSANVSGIVSNLTEVEIAFTGANVGDYSSSEVTNLRYVPSNVDYANGTFDIHTDDINFQSYFGNVANSTITGVTNAISSVSFTVFEKSNVHLQTVTASNVNLGAGTFTFLQSNVTANASNILGRLLSKTKFTVEEHNFSTGEIVKVLSNNIRGYYQIESAGLDTFVLNVPYHANLSSTGFILTPGLHIKTSEDHNIPVDYNGKRVMIHQAENPYYNQVYKVSYVKSNTEIVCEEVYAWNALETDVSPSYTATVDGAVTKSNKIKLDLTSVPRQINRMMIVTGSGITTRVTVTNIDNVFKTGEFTVDQELTLADGITLTFEKECVMTTLDHNVVKLNNTSIRVDDVTSPQGILESINKTQAIKSGVINTTGNNFGLGIPMLKRPVMPDGTPYSSFAGKSPYVRSEGLSEEITRGLTKSGHIKINSDTSGYKPFQKGTVTTNVTNRYGDETYPSLGRGHQSTINNYLGQPSYYGAGGDIIKDNERGQQYAKSTGAVIDIPVFSPDVKNTNLNSGRDTFTPIFTGQALEDAPDKRCGPDACATRNFRGKPLNEVKGSGPINWGVTNFAIQNSGSITVSGTISGSGHGKRKWTSEYSGYYSPAGQVGGDGDGGLTRRAIAGAKTWSDNGSTQSFNIPIKVTEGGIIYIHAYQEGKRSYSTSQVSVATTSGNVTIDKTSVSAKYIGRAGEGQITGGSSGVIRVAMEAGSEIMVTGTSKGGGNHWHAMEMHVSGSRTGLSKLSERIENANNNSGSGTPAGVGNGDFTIHHYSDEKGVREIEEFYFETPGSGTSVILFEHYSGYDAIQVFQGQSKGNYNTQPIAESDSSQLRRLTNNERQELKNQFAVNTGGVMTGSGNYANIDYDNHNLGPPTKASPHVGGKQIAVAYAGALEFSIDSTLGTHIMVRIPKNSYVFDHIIKLPNGTPPPDDPGQDPNPVVPCGQNASIPSGPGDTTTQPPGSNTTGTSGSSSNTNTGGSNNSGSTTPVNNPGGAGAGSTAKKSNSGGEPVIGKNANTPIAVQPQQVMTNNNVLHVTKKQSIYKLLGSGLGFGGNALQKNNYSVQYLAQTSGFYRPPMTGLGFIPSIFRKTVKTVSSTNFGVPISLASGRYVNNQVQKISGGFVVPLAQRLTTNIPLNSRPLRNIDAQELPYYNVLDANTSAFDKGGMFHKFMPQKINGDYNLGNGTYLDITGATLTGADMGFGLGELLFYTQPYNGIGIDDDAPVDTMPISPPETIAEGPVVMDDPDIRYNPNMQITLQPKIGNQNGGPIITVPLYKPKPGHTIDLNNIAGLDPEDTISINGRTVGPFKGTSQSAIMHAINCIDATGFEAFPIGTDHVRISSCSNVPLTIKEGCSGGTYKEVLDFHINRSFTDQEVSNTAVIGATTNILDANGSIVDTAVSYPYLDVDGGIIGFANSTASSGTVLSSRVVSTGGSGYAIGDRLRLLGGTPIKDPFTGVAEICVKNPGAGYSLPENIVVTIGDGSTPGRNATVSKVIFDSNNGIEKVVLASGGEEYDINRPPKVTIQDLGQIGVPTTYSNALSRGDLIRWEDHGITALGSIGSIEANIVAGEYFINDVATNENVNFSAHSDELDSQKASFKITITETDGVKSANVDVVSAGNYWEVGQTFAVKAKAFNNVEGADFTFNVAATFPNMLFYGQLTQDSTDINTLGNALQLGIISIKNGILQPQQAKLEAVLENDPKAQIPRVAKFEVTSVDPIGGITSVKILDRGIYKVFPSDLTNGLPLEYDHVLLGDEAGFNADGTVYSGGSGLGQFNPLDLSSLSSPGAYDPINNKLLGGSGARIFLTSSEIPDCSEPGGAKRALGLPDIISDIDAAADLASQIQAGIGDAGYGPDDFLVRTVPINDEVSQIDITSPIFDGIGIDELTPGTLDKIGLPPGDYNVASLCIQAIIETRLKDDNPVVLNKLNKLADDLGLGLDTEGPIDVIKLLCIDTIGNNDGDNGQDAISIFGDGDVTFIKDLFQYELRTLTGDPVSLLSTNISQEADVLYMESQRYSKNTDLTNANTNYSTIDSNVSNYANIWIDNYNDTGKWAYLENGTVIREQEDLVDPKFVDKVITYDNESGIKQHDIHLYDPFKGVIPGFIDNEIHFIGDDDPVVYDVARSHFCDDDLIGTVWWDTSTIRYNWYEQGTTRDRWIKWGSAFPGSTISLYEWTKTDVPPDQWSISGTPRSQYIIKDEMEPVSGKIKSYYYYWVRNSKTIPNFVRENLNRKIDTFTLAKYLADPLGNGLNLISFVDKKSFVLHNISTILNDDNDNLQINFSRNRNPNGKKHDSWLLARQNDNNSKIPQDLSEKIIDSLCGFDATGLAVPDTNLSEVEKYGAKFRPRQTMFKNVKKARRIAVEFINGLFKNIKMNSEFFNWNETLSTSSNYYHTENWYAVRRTNPTTKQNEYYDETFKPVYRVNSTSDFKSLKDLIDGSIVQVKGSDSERSKIYIYDGNADVFNLISIENEIIQIKDTAFTDNTNTMLNKELRSILNIIKNNAFNNSNNWNNLFFRLLEYAYSEQSGLDWAFKTSYVYVEKEETDLIEFKGFKPDNFDKVLEYMNEAKPFTSKIREYKDGKQSPIEFIKDQMISDYDKPPYADLVTGTVRILDDNSNSDQQILASSNMHKQYHSISNKSESPIRQGKTTIAFDRTNWQPTQFEWNPNNESANSSIATNIAWLKSGSNIDVAGAGNVRAIDKIIKFDPNNITTFTNEMETYLSGQGYELGSGSNVTLISNATILFNAIEAGGLDKTLNDARNKVGGNFIGDILDANLFTKVVEGYDPSLDYQSFFGYDSEEFDSLASDISAEVINYSGTFDSSLINFRRNDQTFEGFDGATFSRMLYGEDRPEELIQIDPKENFVITVTTSPYANANTSSNIVVANAQQVVYRVHRDMEGSTQFLRIRDNTTLTANLTTEDRTITVANASILPRPTLGKPGVLWVESERITYKERDTSSNIISGITRGTRGTTVQDHIVTDESGATVTIKVYDGSEDQDFTDLVGQPESNTFLDTGAVSITDFDKANASSVSSIMKFLHDK